jgi:hypothetical protein
MELLATWAAISGFFAVCLHYINKQKETIEKFRIQMLRELIEKIDIDGTKEHSKQNIYKFVSTVYEDYRPIIIPTALSPIDKLVKCAKITFVIALSHIFSNIFKYELLSNLLLVFFSIILTYAALILYNEYKQIRYIKKYIIDKQTQ